jgi:hypothetical protein
MGTVEILRLPSSLGFARDKSGSLRMTLLSETLSLEGGGVALVGRD